MEVTTNKRVNSGRQLELDIARGLAVIFMVAVNVVLTFGTKATNDSSIAEIIDLFGGVPAAPVFMFLLGSGIVYSRKSDAKTLFKRGILLFLAGYSLNILRSVIPEVILFIQNQNVTDNIGMRLYYCFFNVDILQFAGLAFIFFAFLKLVKTPLIGLVSIGLVFILINQFIPKIENFNVYLAPITSLIIGGASNEGLSYFPFITWIIYPIAGYVFAYYAIQTTDKKQFYTRLTLGSLVILVTYTLGVIFLQWPTGYETEAGYYTHSGILNFVYTAFVLFWISLFFWMSGLVRGPIKNFLQTASSQVSNIYFIHWVMLGMLTVVIGRESNGVAFVLLMIVPIFVLSYILSIVYSKFQKQMKTKEKI